MIFRTLLCLLLFASVANGIVIRHDRDEALYRDMAAQYPMVCRVGQGMGTLIDSLWVLTAGHVAEMQAREAIDVRFGDRTIAVTDIVVHPNYAVPNEHRDLALLKLARPVTDIPIARLYRESNELHQQITFVGDGRFGDGQRGPSKGDRIMRAAHNTVDSVKPGWIVFHFDAPPDGDSLEGISGPGDSGGPAILWRNGMPFIIGVSAYNDGDPECFYGTNEYYSRVSDELEWIDDVMGGSVTAEKTPRLMRYGQTDGGKQTVESGETETVAIPPAMDRVLLNVIARIEQSVQANSVDQYLTLFTARFLKKNRDKDNMVTAMHAFLVNAMKKRGPIIGYHPPGREGFAIPDSEFPMRPVVFHLEDGTPGYFGIALTPDGQIDHLSLFIMEGICERGSECPETQTLTHMLESMK